MALLPVEAALARILAKAWPMDAEEVPLDRLAGRVLATDVCARLSQPPFDASAMDGYAVRAQDVTTRPATLKLIGESAAGHGFAGHVRAGETVRIFTGAPVPEGADAIVIQENVAADGPAITIVDGTPDPAHVRPRGGDFKEGDVALRKGHRLTSRDVLLAAAMGHATLSCARPPKVAILATGDELVEPGETPRADQIVSSNPYGLAAMLAAFGASPVRLGIARDTRESLAAKLEEAADADILLTIGGASVGDHDLVVPTLQDAGVTLDFWKIAMRPGKPMIFGHRDRHVVLGLPGNPVSSMICARVFAVPLVLAMLGRQPEAAQPIPAALATPLETNGPRTHFMRALRSTNGAGLPVVCPIASQDSSLMAPLATADCLVVRPPGAPALPAGASVDTLPLDF
ncbi:MAG: molybdopterin molybdotransferase MoeA [Hyphomicrobiaceae bacterium]|nr:molybdopterin molybdotransferase MoeA [Hyphomicrobiaceae bacterium]